MPQRPEVTATNYEQVYDYYQTPRIHSGFNRTVFKAAHMLYRPDVLLSSETRQSILTQLSMGKGALIAANHPSQHDPFVAAAAMYETEIPELQEFMGLAKDSLFRGPTRPLFEKTGCIPVFRSKNYTSVDPTTMAASTQRMLAVAAERLQQGKAVALMPEGTRSPVDGLYQLSLARIRSGIARVAEHASDDRSFIVPLGIAYRCANPRNRVIPPRHTVVAIGDPVIHYDRGINGIRQQVYESIQSTLDHAVAHTQG